MSNSPLRVLLVEDQFLIAKQLEVILKTAGHTVVGIASTRDEGCALAVSENPDIALVDISLADGPTGAEVAQFITDNCKARVVFATANRRRVPLDFCGALGVVEKPFTPAGLLSALNFILANWSGAKSENLKLPASLVLSPAFEAQLLIA